MQQCFNVNILCLGVDHCKLALRCQHLGSQADRHLLAAALPDAVDIVYGNVGDYVSCKAAMEDIDKVSHA